MGYICVLMFWTRESNEEDIPLKGSKFPRVKLSSTNCLVTKALQLVLDYCKSTTCGTSYPRTTGNFLFESTILFLNLSDTPRRTHRPEEQTVRHLITGKLFLDRVPL